MHHQERHCCRRVCKPVRRVCWPSCAGRPGVSCIASVASDTTPPEALHVQVLLHSDAVLLVMSGNPSAHGDIQDAATTCLGTSLHKCWNASSPVLDAGSALNAAEVGGARLCSTIKAGSFVDMQACKADEQSNLTSIALVDSLAAEAYVLNKTLAENYVSYAVRPSPERLLLLLTADPASTALLNICPAVQCAHSSPRGLRPSIAVMADRHACSAIPAHTNTHTYAKWICSSMSCQARLVQRRRNRKMRFSRTQRHSSARWWTTVLLRPTHPQHRWCRC